MNRRSFLAAVGSSLIAPCIPNVIPYVPKRVYSFMPPAFQVYEEIGESVINPIVFHELELASVRYGDEAIKRYYFEEEMRCFVEKLEAAIVELDMAVEAREASN